MDNKKPIRQTEKREKVLPVIGTVVNCEILRVRAKPSKDPDTEILTFIKKGDQVEINMKLSTNDFYSVTVTQIITAEKYIGYCMKDFIHVEE